MTNKIQKPPDHLLSIGDEQNVTNLKVWIELLTKPFKDKGYAQDNFLVANVLDGDSENFLDEKERELVRVHFPTTLNGLYDTGNVDGSDSGVIALSIGNKARISFMTSNHAVTKYRDSKGITGTYEEVTKFYLEYLNDLMAVPKPKSLK